MLAEAMIFLVSRPFPGIHVDSLCPGANMGVLGVIVPGLIGMAYGSLLLAIVWGSKLIRAPFEFYAIRFIGLISFSLYLWHLPIILPLIPELINRHLTTLRRLPWPSW